MGERIKVDIKKEGSLVKALKVWKKKSIFIVKELKERKEYIKPSFKKREQKRKAIHKIIENNKDLKDGID